ncbi:MAG: hypothetical protein ACJAT5_000992 [Lentimonas sp.]|jgi:hypothetical protein
MWQTGPLKVWLIRSGLEWKIAHQLVEDEDLAKHEWQRLEQAPSEASWQRWAFSNPHDQVLFEPVMPDRPLIVKTLTPTQIPPGMEAAFYVNIPLWAAVKAGRESNWVNLTSMSSVILSDTWFGNNSEGEFCYALKTKAVRDAKDVSPQPHRALCPILIVNKANTTLPLQKICIRAKYLNTYVDNEHLWTNRISVTFLGKGLPSKVNYEHTPPAELENPELVSKATERYESGFFKTLGQSFIDLF